MLNPAAAYGSLSHGAFSRRAGRVPKGEWTWKALLPSDTTMDYTAAGDMGRERARAGLLFHRGAGTHQKG